MNQPFNATNFYNEAFDDWRRWQPGTHDQRLGQFVINRLRSTEPAIYQLMMDNEETRDEVDCFYDNGKIEAFFTWLSHMDGLEVVQ